MKIARYWDPGANAAKYGIVEGDTVNINSWVVFPSGGSDVDSPCLPTGAGSTPPMTLHAARDLLALGIWEVPPTLP